MWQSPRKSFVPAFSLIELSIVLVILGLLTGGILAGQSLVHAAELRSVSIEWNRYQTAIYTFRDKYFALPGDMANASSVWPTATNGPGSGMIGTYWTGGVRLWQHLSLAGLIEGKFTGTMTGPYAGSGGCVGNVECPASKLQSLIYEALTVSNPNTPPYTINGKNGISLNSGISMDWSTGMKPIDAYNIDRKIDDGAPGSGNIFGMGPGGFSNGDGWSTCATDSAGTSYIYTGTGNSCRPFFAIK